jgi:hypothetical protein
MAVVIIRRKAYVSTWVTRNMRARHRLLLRVWSMSFYASSLRLARAEQSSLYDFVDGIFILLNR